MSYHRKQRSVIAKLRASQYTFNRMDDLGVLPLSQYWYFETIFILADVTSLNNYLQLYERAFFIVLLAIRSLMRSEQLVSLWYKLSQYICKAVVRSRCSKWIGFHIVYKTLLSCGVRIWLDALILNSIETKYRKFTLSTTLNSTSLPLHFLPTLTKSENHLGASESYQSVIASWFGGGLKIRSLMATKWYVWFAFTSFSFPFPFLVLSISNSSLILKSNH